MNKVDIIKELKKAGVVLPYRKGRSDVDTDSIRKEVPENKQDLET